MKLLQALAIAVATPFIGGTASAQVVSLITTPAGTFSNSAGSAIAKVANDKAKIRMTVQAQASTGYEEIEAGQVEFNLSNSFDATFFATGKGEYEGRGPAKMIRHVAALTPYRVAMHVKADSDIKSIRDLKGKRVSSEFNAQKTIGRIIEAHLANGGLSYKDVVGVPAPNVFRQAEDFKTGKVDVMFFALGSAAIKEAAAAVGGVRVLPVDDSPGAIKRMQDFLPGSYVITVEPSPQVDGLAGPTRLVAFDMDLNTGAKVRDDVVYRLTKALFESKKELVAAFPGFIPFEPRNMAKPRQGVEFHPGAIKFYQEAGMWPPREPGAAAPAVKGESTKKK